MEMGVEAGAEAIEEAHSTEGDGDWNGGTGLPQGGPGGSKQEMEDGAAVGASGPSGRVGRDAAVEVPPGLFFHVIQYAFAHGIGLVGQGKAGLQVFPDGAVQGGGLGAASPVGLRIGSGRWFG
jgi:hypothetical protein